MAILTGLTPRFRCGELHLTSRAREVLHKHRIEVQSCLRRHLNGDWGDVKPAMWIANANALLFDGRLVSGYLISRRARLIIITESDRSSTTLYVGSDCPWPVHWRDFLSN